MKNTNSNNPATMNQNPQPQVRLSRLTGIAFEMNAVLDEAPDLQLTFKEVEEAAERKHLVEYLVDKCGERIDLSLLTSRADELAGANEALHQAAQVVSHNPRGKFGVERNGLCLVMAIILEAIHEQHGALRRMKQEEDDSALAA